MVLDSRIQLVRNFYGVRSLDDWQRVTPEQVLFVENVGPATLNHIRVYLAARGLTLANDRTPEYWNEHLGTAKIVQSIADEERFDVCPFTIVVDVNETLPYRFDSIANNGTPMKVKTERLPLYRYGLADYTIRGMEQDIQIERKGDDLPSSLTSRRENFEREIMTLNQTCDVAYIVVEQTVEELATDTHEHGANWASIHGTWQSWSIKYPRVHWHFVPGREFAERHVFELLAKFWKLKSEELALDAEVERQHLMASVFRKV